MFDFIFGSKKENRPTKKYGSRSTYKQVAVRPAAHSKLWAMADKENITIVDLVDRLVGVN